MRKSLIIAQIKCIFLRFLSQESETPLLILSLSKCLEQYHMIDSGIYLLQVQVRKIRNAIITAGNYIITLRVGKNSSSSNFVRTGSDKQVQVSAFLQMNVDKSALQAQRCSLSVTSEDKKMIGLALVSIPQETTTLSNTYKLTQNEDKRAQIDLKLKISPFEEIKIQINRVKQQQLEQNRNQKKLSMNQAKDNNGLISKMGLNFSKIDCLPSYINLKSKISDEASHISSEQRPNLKNFKLIEQSKIIQVSQSEIKRFRDEKQVYYQLYQIQKTKSEIALKFISTITKKLVIKYPSLAQQDQPKIFAIEQRKSTKQNSSHQKQNNQAQIQQLQQANRSLHRQVQQYKKIVQQLKEEMHRLLTKGQNKKVNNLSKQNKILPDFLDLSFSRAEKERSPRNHRDNHPQQSITDSIKGINLEKWLQASIGERKALQAMFITIEPHLASTQPPKDKILLTKIKQQLLQKLKSKMDKEFISLLKSKQFNKQILINHRRQLNKLLQQCFLQ